MTISSPDITSIAGTQSSDTQSSNAVHVRLFFLYPFSDICVEMQ